ncbi:MAG: LL-diaminopimelate aminotransferase [Clostridia bacterium]|nr:LL-diaminopimelate aminotransferase [Clostridia bacterium]
MFQANTRYRDLSESYLFVTVARKMREFAQEHPDADIIKMSIGDVTRPIVPAARDAMLRAVNEMATSEGFRGYGPEQGYDFLRQAIAGYYASLGVTLDPAEIFVSDGAKSDCGNLPDILGSGNRVLIPDPVYPVYRDTNIMNGSEVRFMQATQENGFLPLPDENTEADVIYLCSPNNPTGAVYDRAQLKKWVDFANAHGALILFDAAYEAFVNNPALPRSIFEIDGARRCAIELCSLSKTAGFTGVRCGYTVVPQELCANGLSLNKLWLRRQSTKFNGVSYITQRGAEAVFTPDGLKQVRENIAYYRENARTLTDMLDALGWWYTGGKHSPYVWFRCPDHMDSWSFFDRLLTETQVVGTPGAGFGACGEHFFRLTSFSTHENTRAAADRLLRAYR